MTITEAKQLLLNIAIKEINYHEVGNNYIKYAEGDWDNKFYGWELQGQPWCDVFVDWCFSQAFGLQKAQEMTYQTKGGSAACRYSAEYYQQNGAYYNYPEVGDQIFFYSGGAINHTGIVETVAGTGQAWTSITTIEGNTSDQVARRNYSRGNGSIAGFGRPNWNLVVNEELSLSFHYFFKIVFAQENNTVCCGRDFSEHFFDRLNKMQCRPLRHHITVGRSRKAENC